MRRLQSIVFITFLFNQLTALAQLESFSVINPLEISPALSGNYGELRPNHFHAGLDLKTAGEVNLPVHVVERGFVSRIKVSPYGYGKVVYVDHPQGYTTVYAHLNRFNDAIEEYIKQEQYRLQSFAVDVYPGENDIPIAKSDILAYSGNTGGSGGPHLHFEVRETKSEIPRNPLLFNFPIADNKKPVIEAVGIVDFVSNNHKRYRTNAIRNTNTIRTSQEIGIEVSGYDSQDGSINRNGIFELSCYIDGQLHSEIVADSIPFDKSRQLNALIDYDHYYRTHQRFVRLFKLPGNFLNNLKCKNSSGRIKLDEGEHDIEIVAKDASGNRSSISFKLTASIESPASQQPGEMIDCSAHYFYESETSRIAVQPYSFYENIELDMLDTGDKLEFLTPFTPINYPIEVQLKRDYRDGEILARFTKDGRPIHALPTNRSGDWLIGTSKSLGVFGVTNDNQPPSIESVNFVNNRVYNSGKINFTIADNFSGIQTFDASVDDNWVLAEYEPKKKRLSINLDEIAKQDEPQHLRIEISDMAGNVGTFEGSFIRK